MQFLGSDFLQRLFGSQLHDFQESDDEAGQAAPVGGGAGVFVQMEAVVLIFQKDRGEGKRCKGADLPGDMAGCNESGCKSRTVIKGLDVSEEEKESRKADQQGPVGRIFELQRLFRIFDDEGLRIGAFVADFVSVGDFHAVFTENIAVGEIFRISPQDVIEDEIIVEGTDILAGIKGKFFPADQLFIGFDNAGEGDGFLSFPEGIFGKAQLLLGTFDSFDGGGAFDFLFHEPPEGLFPFPVGHFQPAFIQFLFQLPDSFGDPVDILRMEKEGRIGGAGMEGSNGDIQMAGPGKVIELLVKLVPLCFVM